MASPAAELDVWVKSISHVAEGIHSFDLRPCDGDTLPAFTAGAHVTVRMSEEVSRSYSLTNSQDERNRYVIVVSKDRASRGGSQFMHDCVRVGDRLRLSQPRNNFPLTESASKSVFIAGGIGITPLWSMIQRLNDLGRRWELHYATRTRFAAPFLAELAAIDTPNASRLHCHFDDECGGRPLDMVRILEGACDAHLYCCGPLQMLKSFETLTAHFPPGHVHIEYFVAKDDPARGGFFVHLERSRLDVYVQSGKSILDEVLERGVDASFSCKEGTCGTCEVRVLEGIPDHRDAVLSEQERRTNSTMMICCSGCQTGGRLVLDL
jgi:tetrachlorobenzoquinone reductase